MLEAGTFGDDGQDQRAAGRRGTDVPITSQAKLKRPEVVVTGSWMVATDVGQTNENPK